MCAEEKHASLSRNLDILAAKHVRFRLDSKQALKSQSVISNVGRGGRRYAPYAFTEHGVAMLSSVLKSKRAIQMNILIVRAFVSTRELLANNKDLALRVEKLEAEQKDHTSIISILADEINKMKRAPSDPPKYRIGFRAD